MTTPRQARGAGINVNEQRCLNARHKRAECRRCVDVCPADALTLDSNRPHLDAEQCVGCGLCLSACPTDVFAQPASPEDTLAALEKALPAGACALVCPQQPAPDTTRAPVQHLVRHTRCLAALSIAHYLELSDGDRRALWLDDSQCSECPLGTAHATLLQTVEAANQVLRAFDRAPALHTHTANTDALLPAPVMRPLYEGSRPVYSRRSMFTSLSRFARDAAQASTSPANPAMPASRRRLIEHIRRLGEPAQRQISTKALPCAAVDVDAEACSACGRCARSCPTDALAFTRDDDTFTLAFEPASCIDCELCATVCPEDAIRFETHIAASALTASRPQPLASGRLVPCATCGIETAAQTGPRCFSCRAGNRPPTPRHDAAGLFADLQRRQATKRPVAQAE